MIDLKSISIKLNKYVLQANDIQIVLLTTIHPQYSIVRESHFEKETFKLRYIEITFVYFQLRLKVEFSLHLGEYRQQDSLVKLRCPQKNHGILGK